MSVWADPWLPARSRWFTPGALLGPRLLPAEPGPLAGLQQC